jgi:hypothetical protein
MDDTVKPGPHIKMYSRQASIVLADEERTEIGPFNARDEILQHLVWLHMEGKLTKYEAVALTEQVLQTKLPRTINEPSEELKRLIDQDIGLPVPGTSIFSAYEEFPGIEQ